MKAPQNQANSEATQTNAAERFVKPILPQVIAFNPERLNEVVTLLEQEGFTVRTDPFLFEFNIIMAASKGEEAYLIEIGELGQIIRYGVDHLRNFVPKAKQHRDDLSAAQRMQAYAEATMANLVIRLQDAPPKTRNNELFKAAATLGSLLHWDVFDYQEAYYSLQGYIPASRAEQEATIKSGLKKGMQSPRPELQSEKNQIQANHKTNSYQKSSYLDRLSKRGGR